MSETPVTGGTLDDEPETERNPVVDELEVHNGEPLRPTFFDGNGVERIAGPPVEGWKPAQVDPTDEQIARNEAFHAREAERRNTATELLSGPTSEPLYDAQTAYHEELDAATSDTGVTDVTPTDPGTPTGDPTAPAPTGDPTGTTGTPTPPAPTSTSDQQAVEAAAVADADATVAAQVEAERAQAAEAQRQADDAALAAAEAQEVKDEEGQS